MTSDVVEPDYLVRARDSLLAWERSESLADVRWRDVPLWRLVRNEVIESRLSSLDVRGPSNRNRAGLRGIARFACGIAISLAHLFRLGPARWLFIGFPRRKRERGAWVDPFSDPLIEAFGESDSLCLEKPFFGSHCRPAATRRLMYLDWAMATSVAASLLFGWTSRVFAGSPIDALATAVATQPGIDRRHFRKHVGRELVRFRVEAAIMAALLRVVRPKAVLLTSRWVHLPLIYACKRAGAVVLELQHGVPNERGFKYSTQFDRGVDPDQMLTFGSHWDGFDWGLPRSRVVPIGFPYIWRRRTELGRSRGDGHRVMLASQPEMSRELGAAFGEIATAHEDVEFLLKLHPQDLHGWRRRYGFAGRPNVHVCDDAAADLYELFLGCRAVVGHNSTVLFEASFFGLKVGILNARGDNPCPALRYAGHFNFFEIRRAADLRTMLQASVAAHADNPFLAEFDRARFLGLAGAPAGAQP